MIIWCLRVVLYDAVQVLQMQGENADDESETDSDEIDVGDQVLNPIWANQTAGLTFRVITN